ncbi:calponin homology domain-containing protein DDB_G0272472 [Scaptodrosophila lebanonensis]|uniref:Calponin homology domain-containing protein DDB_G0272472 n=1 Tax=Drosophila lebanonensis TaxID=7225 RepID=A0A6J2T749_DROLE|nr:calponin homology domain-containing protein DDB_G0272472 [Scaptodrosophila lebanonensis]
MNGSRNLCTLAEKLMKRRRTADVFERDPFKVQSYNFRYAEKPNYPVQQFPRSDAASSDILGQRSTEKKFEVFYHNPNFVKREREREQPPSNPQPSSIFHAHRRRKFLNDFQCVNTTMGSRRSNIPPMPDLSKLRNSNTVAALPRRMKASGPPHADGNGGRSGVGVRTAFLGSGGGPLSVTNSPLLSSCCNRGDYLTCRRGSSSMVLAHRTSSCKLAQHKRNTGSPAPAPAPATDKPSCRFNLGNKRTSTTLFARSQSTMRPQGAMDAAQGRRSTQAVLGPTPSSCSGCEININISSMDSDDEGEQVRIKIEADAACLLNNTDKATEKDLKHGEKPQCSKSVASLIDIDKRLSKFCVGRDELPTYRGRPCTDPLVVRRVQEQRRERLREELRRERAQFDDQQRELTAERQQARQREQEREQLRQAEREQDRQRLLELEAERERDRLRELERQSQRQRECLRQLQERLQWEHDRLPLRPTIMASQPHSQLVPRRVLMQSHLCRRMSTDRLPGMMPLRALQNAGEAPVIPLPAPSPAPRPAARTPNADMRMQRLHSSVQNLQSMRGLPSSEDGDISLERRSSGSSNVNELVGMSTESAVRGRGGSSTCVYRRRASGTMLPEPKLLNVHRRSPCPMSPNDVLANATSPSNPPRRSTAPHAPITTRINNMPIRITTTQPPDDEADFSVNQIRVPNSATGRRRSQVQDHSEDSTAGPSSPYNVHINVYADNLRMMRL